ncbi:hypothetical protein [Kitasatospora sp. NPDC088548]|uniref:hypothetical protein n=1 Tax=Kitasatospora sp. NPDC088548 TaxID=3364075 RepID=UPI0037F29529
MSSTDTLTVELSMTVSEATIFTFPVQLRVPADLVDEHDDEYPALAAWLNENRELWMDAIDPSKHMQDTQELDVIFVDVHGIDPDPSAGHKAPTTGTVHPTSGEPKPGEEGNTHAPPLP